MEIEEGEDVLADFQVYDVTRFMERINNSILGKTKRTVMFDYQVERLDVQGNVMH